MKQKTNIQIAMRVSFETIIGNILLATFKFIAGILSMSYAMISDAIHSASDVFSTIIVMLGVKISNKKSDDNHPYGHERFECVAAIILAVILFATGIGIGWAGLKNIIDGNYSGLAVPGVLALIAAVVSIIVKELMFWYTRHYAIKINSGALHADAWHHRSDALSSIGSFVGILGARLGVPILDSVACLVISLMIVKVAISIFIDAVRKMTDEACDEKTESEIKQVILDQTNVLGIDILKTRKFGDKIYVEVEICADGSMPLKKTHDIAQNVHDAIEQAFPLVKHCTVHTNPVKVNKKIE